MSFYDDASLVFLPSGGAGKDGKAYSMKPTNGNGDFTFSRGSNLTATRVDSNGLIEKGRENLLLQSNQFDTTWTTSNLTPTGGETGYDGSSDAWLLDISGGTSSQRIEQSMSFGGIQTFSVYAKAGTLNWIRMRGSSNTYFDLANGVIGTDGHIDSKIESIGNGWYRCSVVTETSTLARIYLATDDGNVTQSSGSIYIQDAQLEQGLAATEYIESGATTGLAGILEDSPRFDYSGGASCPSLLLEPQRTNNIPQSEYLGDSIVWAQLETIVTQNEEVSPEGLQNASKLLCVSGFANHQIDAMNVSISSGAVTGSVYAKKGANADWLRLRLSGTSNPPRAWFDLQNGVVGSVDVSGTASIEDVGNGWYRCSLTEAGNTASGGGGRLQIFINKSDGQTQFTSNGDEYHYVYGAQMEAGSYATSYIPNHSGSGSVTREADITSVTSVSDLIGQTEGTIYCEFEYNGAADTGVFNRIIALGTGVTQNRILLAKNDTTAELVAFAVTGGTTQVFQAIATTSIIGHHKVAMSYKANEYKVYLDGQLKFTDSSASVPATTDVYIGTAEDGTTNNELGGVVKQSIIYKEVLSEDNCKALTTL
jgi:hypothetical protein